jgi:hypothetical protein
MIYNLCQLIINLTLVNADWKKVWYNAVKRNWTITYFTSVLFTDETSMIRLTQTRMKIHHASSIRLIKNKLFTDETLFK